MTLKKGLKLHSYYVPLVVYIWLNECTSVALFVVCDLVVDMPLGCRRIQPAFEVILEVTVYLVRAMKVGGRRSFLISEIYGTEWSVSRSARFTLGERIFVIH